MIYILIFIFSLYFLWRAEKSIEQGRNYQCHLLLAVLFPILLAAVRAKNIGVDMEAYLVPWFVSSKKFDSFLNFCNFNVDSKEYLYYALIYYPSRIFGCLFPSLLIQQILIIFGIIKLLIYFKRKSNINMTYAYAIYLLLYYNESLCIMRQSVAVSFGMLAMISLLENRIKMFLAYSLIAFLFHNSILSFSVIVYGFYLINKSFAKSKTKYVLFLLLFLLMSSMSLITNIVSSINVNERFVERLAEGEENQGGYLTILMYSIYVFIPLLINLRHKKVFSNSIVWLLPIVGFVFLILAKQSIYFGRMAYPFFVCLIITLASYLRRTKIQYFVLLLVLAYWYYVNGISDTWGTYSYLVDSNYNMF